jgi:hypothetical protein
MIQSSGTYNASVWFTIAASWGTETLSLLALLVISYMITFNSNSPRVSKETGLSRADK